VIVKIYCVICGYAGGRRESGRYGPCLFVLGSRFGRELDGIYWEIDLFGWGVFA